MHTGNQHVQDERQGEAALVRVKPKIATITDVAKLAAVSPMSVSNYLNRRFQRMSEETQARIRRAIAELGYRPQSAARELRLRKAFSVGMIVVDPSTNFLSDPFIGRVVSGMSAELARHGYACLLQGLNNGAASDALLSNYSRTDGLCILPSGSTPTRRRLIQSLLRLGEPMVLIEEIERYDSPDVAVVRQDDRGGASMVVRHLLECGARSFAFLTPAPVWPAMIERERGIRATLKAAGTQTSFEKITCGFGVFQDVEQALDQWMAGHKLVDALIGNNDQIGISAARMLARRGIRVPEDIMVTGFNAFELWNYGDPPLTTIVTPPYELGQRSAQLLLQRLETGSFPVREVVLPVSLRVAESTRPIVR